MKKNKVNAAAAAAASTNAIQWEEAYFRDRFMELVEYKAQNGHCDVPYRSNNDGSTNSILGPWTKAL